MAGVGLDAVGVHVGGRALLQGVTLEVADGAFVAIVGSSGSGKTTLLRTVAGLVRPSAGTIRFDGADITLVEAGRRDVGMVFQQAALLRHISVRRNVSFPLDVRRQTAEEIRRRVDAEVRALHIERLLLQRPDELSYGEAQMVQIARTLVRVPRVLLLDEPFASLDEQLRGRMRAEIRLLQEGYGVTTLMTTNDPRDVAALAGSVVVLEEGRLVQAGSTVEVRETPATLLAAATTGDLSTFDATVVAESTGSWLVRDDPSGGPGLRLRSWSPALAEFDGQLVTVAVRPEHVVITPSGSVVAGVERSIPGSTPVVQLVVAGARIQATPEPGVAHLRGETVRARIDHHHVFDRTTGRTVA